VPEAAQSRRERYTPAESVSGAWSALTRRCRNSFERRNGTRQGLNRAVFQEHVDGGWLRSAGDGVDGHAQRAHRGAAFGGAVRAAACGDLGDCSTVRAMEVEQQPRQRGRVRCASTAVWLLIGSACVGALALACGESGSECGRADCSPAVGGDANGGSSSSLGGASSGGKPSGGTSGQSVDCTAVCGHVKTLCSENSAISDVWVDACKSACDARAQLTPEVAELENACVMAAADCSAAVSCVASPH